MLTKNGSIGPYRTIATERSLVPVDPPEAWLIIGYVVANEVAPFGAVPKSPKPMAVELGKLWSAVRTQKKPICVIGLIWVSMIEPVPMSAVGELTRSTTEKRLSPAGGACGLVRC